MTLADDGTLNQNLNTLKIQKHLYFEQTLFSNVHPNAGCADFAWISTWNFVTYAQNF